MDILAVDPLVTITRCGARSVSCCTVEVVLVRCLMNSRQRWTPSWPGQMTVDRVVGHDLTFPAWRDPSNTRPRRKRAWGGSLVSFIALPSNLPGDSKDPWDM